MTAPTIILQLVERFEQHRETYRAGKYNETQLRREFLDPFFKALGWDVDNEQGYAETYKDVIHEDSLEVEGATKAPDYAFRVGGTRKFFVEAKKPSVKIETDIHPAFQLRRYAWSAKLPLSILTDFEEFAVYDCRAKPDKTDKASQGRVLFLNYRAYVEKWDEIAAIFSREAVLKGSFDQFAEQSKGKKGTADVDDAFLQEIERWRELLARNIALRNPSLSVRELNFAVQMTIDRLVFLRICEDRGIERYEQLKELGPHRPSATSPKFDEVQSNLGEAGRGQIYPALCELFRRADVRYNSGLFHFASDTLSLGLNMDDKVLKDIIANLYYPDSPYAFAVIPADILGQVYERFLGKVIRLTDGHQAKVEEKPEVRKAGGVYYTPTYIVDYIVRNTLGALIDGKTPEEVAKLKFVDPACGSGSFLLGAYQFLLDWHTRWYSEHDPAKWARGKNPPIFQGKDGWQLTLAKKKELLTNNIYGVDIDAQAVEVTKLSMLLKVVENPGQLNLLAERLLPDLGDNIKCGNSLIGPDYYADKQMPLIPDDEFYRVNVFDWKKAFPQVFTPSAPSVPTGHLPQIRTNPSPYLGEAGRRTEPVEVWGQGGGFDAVIGNPPYVRQESLSEFKEYFQKHYKSYDGVADLYVYFIEKGLNILREGGLYSIIVSSSFLRATYGKGLRTYLGQNSEIIRIVDFGGLAIFENAKDTYVCIPLLSRNKPGSTIEVCKVPSVQNIDLQQFVAENHYVIPTTQFTPEVWSVDNVVRLNLFQKIMSNGIGLGKYTNGQICYGIKTGLNEAFVIDTPTRDRLISQDPKSAEIIKPLLQGEDIRHWFINYKDRWLIFSRRGTDIDAYPAIKAHLAQWKDDLTPKQDKDQKRGRKPGRYKWYEIQDDVAYYQVFDGPKIIFPDIAKGPRFFFDNEGHYLANTAYAIGTNDLYLLGILNSKLFWFAISNISIPFGIRAGEYRYRLIYQYMEKVPIHVIDFSKSAEKAAHDKLVGLVESMLALHKQSPRTPQEKDMLQRQIEATDAAIDALVYQLYGLTEDEIRVVEGR